MIRAQRNRDDSRATILECLRHRAPKWVSARVLLGELREGGPWSEDLQALVREGLVECMDAPERMGLRSCVRLAGGPELESIAAVAVRIPDGRVFTVPRPARHDAAIRVAHRAVRDRGDPLGEHERGFFTSQGRFVGRREAMAIAVAAGQVPPEYAGGKLYSDDLW